MAQSRRERRIAQEAKNDAAFVLESEQGRRFICRMLDQSGYFTEIAADTSIELAHAAGRRKTGLQIVEALQSADPDALLQLLQTAARTRARHSAPHEGKTDVYSDDD